MGVGFPELVARTVKTSKSKKPAIPAARKAADTSGGPRCKGKRADGKPCRARPLRKGSKVKLRDPLTGEFTDQVAVAVGGYCVQHDETLPEQARLGGRTPGAGRPRNVKPVEAIQQLVQSDVLAFFKPHLSAVGLEGFVDDDGQLAVRPREGGGAKLYGTSKDGDVYVSTHEDLEAMQRAAERLLDRGFGKPVQTNLLGQSGDHGPIEVDVPTTAERLRDVAEVLKELEAE